MIIGKPLRFVMKHGIGMPGSDIERKVKDQLW